ncbi:MAG: septum formation protein Maf [Bdellovibrionales bacterium GWA2_49_15]|nr:MAG: septum formation protein Maf [Bdellovibrionales bacterium GWA2_49_15]HAZ11998.1 septum formation protein Maf [Bdellovibrionales bacterium]
MEKNNNADPFRLILASQSPYRRELLSRLAIPFECLSPDIDEEQIKKQLTLQGCTMLELAQALARAKCQAVAQVETDATVIGSDQLVEWQGRVLGKPHTMPAAKKQLQDLQGHTHRLITAVAVQSSAGLLEFVDVTTLHMRSLTEDEITRYLEVDRPFDCAGSYKIEELGIGLFDKIDGQDSTAIIGLPLLELSKTLRQLGFQIP